jgi:predicted aconitase
VLEQPLADVTGGNADDGIFAGVVGGRSAEKLYSDHPLLETVEVAFDGLFDDIAKKLGAAMAAAEGRAFCDFGEVLADRSGIGLFFCSSGVSWPFFVGK